ncbi:MAG: DUF3416 domain-containing protein [Actinomycetales bacterium]|nr:DUF3416 domain-containing protein [Actinomycetales bacterium]
MLGRIVVMDVEPQVNCGSVAVKAISGESREVRATIFREGHEPVTAVLVVRDPAGDVVERVPMLPVGAGGDTAASGVGVEATAGRGPGASASAAVGGAISGSNADQASVGIAMTAAAKAAGHRFGATVTFDAPGRWSCWIECASGGTAAGADDGSPLLTMSVPATVFDVARPLAGFTAWYEFFPRSEGAHIDESGRWVSGTLRESMKRLPDIAAMGFDVVYLPPVNPVGTTKRKGRNDAPVAGANDPGSPWGIGSADGGHDAIHPDLGTIEDYRAFVAAARSHGLEVAFDIALQCSPDHPWVTEHPEWFVRKPDGTIACATNPPKVYEDIFPINFDGEPGPLYEELLRIFRFWIDCGVTIFRCDNSHTKPPQFWQRLIADIKEDRPDIIFNSEGLSHPTMMRTLDKIGFDNSYTRLPWTDGKQALENFFSRDAHDADVVRPLSWTANPDILPTFLHGAPPEAFAIRAAIAALLSPGWAVYSGYELFENTPRREGSVEYLNSEKYEYRPRDWDAVRANPEATLVPWITALNRVRRENAALHHMRTLVFHKTSSDDLLAFSKHVPGNTVLGVIALRADRSCEGTVAWDAGAWGGQAGALVAGADLFTGEAVDLSGALTIAPQSPVRLVALP